MKANEVKALARQHGLKVGRLSKANIIKQIQLVEGNFDCFATPADGYCDQTACMWRPDCLKAS